MEISEQCLLPLNMEDITEYRPRKKEERMESRNLEIDVQVNEEDEHPEGNHLLVQHRLQNQKILLNYSLIQVVQVI